MPNNWKTYKLGEVVNYVNGGAWPANHYCEKGIPVVRVSDVNNGVVDLSECKYLDFIYREKYSKHKLIENDLIICTVGSHPDQQSSVVGGAGIVSKEVEGAYLNQNAVVLRSLDSNIVNQEWLGYLGKSYIFKNHIESEARGSANQVRIAISNLLNLEFDLPPTEEQTAIASILSALDDKIELNLQMNKTLEEMAMALYKHWFVDFGPFQNDEFVDSELGKIPKGWEVKSIYDLIEVIYGAPFKSKLFNEDKKGYPLIRIRDLKFGKPQFYTEEDHVKKTIISKGDILAGMDALFVPYAWSGKEGVMNQRVVFFKPKFESVKRRYIYEAVKPWLKFFESAKVGTTVIHLSKGDIDTFKLRYPINHNVIDEFNRQIEPLHEQIIANYIEISSLTELRDILLPKLISGEVQVKDKDIEQTISQSL